MSDNVENELLDKGRAKNVSQYTAEIHQLKKALVENNSQLVAMEQACLRNVELEDSLIAWQDKYERLHESHKRVQRINESLEDKLLKLVDRSAGERAQLTSDVAALGVRLAQANYNIGTLQREIERYKTDMSLAIQLLQCKPDNFISQKVNSLPHEMQSKLSQYIRIESHSDSEGSTSGIATATDNAYQVLPSSDSPLSSLQFSSSMSTSTPLVHNNGLSSSTKNQMHMTNNDYGEQLISPLGMAKYLEDKLKSANVRHCETCQCSNRDLRVLADIDHTYSVGTQTIIQGDILNSVLCLRCNDILNSPGSNHTPFNMFISCDSIVSDAKSTSNSVGDDSFEKLPIPAITKRDELVVNPILGHTPINDRTIKKSLQPSSSSLASLSITSTTIGSTSTAAATSAGILVTSLNQSNEESSLSSGTQPNSSSKKFNAIAANDTKKYRTTDRSTNQQQKDRTLASSSSSLSNRSSVNVDGPKLFENFNRNLIKSIKAGKPNVTGPRLCAVRIPTDSGNVLIDNIESDAMPVIYTRRNRPLDDELNEKNTITTNESAGSCGNVDAERTFHRISMLMTDGPINTKASTTTITTTTTTTALSTATATSSIEKKNQVFKLETQHNSIISDCTQSQQDDNNSNGKLIDITDDDNNTTKCMEQMHTMTSVMASKQSAHQIDTQTNNGDDIDLELSKLDTFCSTNEMLTTTLASINAKPKQMLNNDEIITMIAENDNDYLNGINDQKQYQFIHMHQYRQQSLTDDTLALKRQQLNRVAEWVKSNSDLETYRNTNVSMNTTTMGSSMGQMATIKLKSPFSKQFNNNFQLNDTINVHHSSVDRNHTNATMLKHCTQSNQYLNLNSNCNMNMNMNVNVNGIETGTETETGTQTGTMIKHKSSHSLNNNCMNCEYDDICSPSALSDINHMEMEHMNMNMENNEQNHSIIDYSQMEYNVKQFLLRPCRYDN